MSRIRDCTCRALWWTRCACGREEDSSKWVMQFGSPASLSCGAICFSDPFDLFFVSNKRYLQRHTDSWNAAVTKLLQLDSFAGCIGSSWVLDHLFVGEETCSIDRKNWKCAWVNVISSRLVRYDVFLLHRCVSSILPTWLDESESVTNCAVAGNVILGFHFKRADSNRTRLGERRLKLLQNTEFHHRVDSARKDTKLVLISLISSRNLIWECFLFFRLRDMNTTHMKTSTQVFPVLIEPHWRGRFCSATETAPISASCFIILGWNAGNAGNAGNAAAWWQGVDVR